MAMRRRELPKLPTPLDHLNAVLSGGLYPTTITELWGPKRGGKSTFAYQMAADLQRANPLAGIDIIDTENAVDDNRLEDGFGMNLSDPHIQFHVTPTLESSFKAIRAILRAHKEDLAIAMKGGRRKGKKAMPTVAQLQRLIIWDTIAVCPTEIALEKDERYAGGMGERSQVIKFWLAKIIAELFETNAFLVIINQVFATMAAYGAKFKSTGGNALQHDIHHSFHFEEVNLQLDEQEDAQFALANVKMTKNRFGPQSSKVPMVIQVSEGGIVNRNASLAESCAGHSLIQGAGGWFWLTSDAAAITAKTKKKSRWADLIQDTGTAETLRKQLEMVYRGKYPTINRAFERLEAAKAAEDPTPDPEPLATPPAAPEPPVDSETPAPAVDEKGGPSHDAPARQPDGEAP